MFFVTSKLFWMFASPIDLLLIAALVGALYSGGRYGRIGRTVAIVALLILNAVAMTPVGLLLAAPLEDRFPQPPADMAPPYGIIILGGAINGAVSSARGQSVFDEGERAVEAAILAQRFPGARIVFSGGNGSLVPGPRNRSGRGPKASCGSWRRSGARDIGGQVPQHGRKRALHCGAGSSRGISALAACHFRISHDSVDGPVREGGFQCDPLSCGLPDARGPIWPGMGL